MIYLPGGPPHQDTFDLKLDAPQEIRGEFRPIPTNVPGLQICEHLPRIAKVCDKLAVIRSIADAVDDHSDFMCMTGRRKANPPPGGWPTFGAVVSKVLGALMPACRLSLAWSRACSTGHITPHRLASGSRASIVSACGRRQGGHDTQWRYARPSGGSQDAARELRSVSPRCGHSGLMDGMDLFNQQAFGVLTSSKLLEALDVSREDAKLRERYGKGDAKVHGDAAPMLNEQFLVARRLVEAGARVVTVAYGFWDYHGNNFKNARADLPMLDQAVSALVADLHQRSLDKDVSVIVWGEFGRTPTINKDAGRDHWPRANCAVLAGGGMRTGQVIGATDRLGGEPTERPVTFGEVFATLYHNLGIDVNKVTVPDFSGRPQFLVPDGAQPVRELVS
jgi:hypothetical protein